MEKIKNKLPFDNIIIQKCYHLIFLIPFKNEEIRKKLDYLIIKNSSGKNEEESKKLITEMCVNQIKQLTVNKKFKEENIIFEWKIYQTKYIDITDLTLFSYSNNFKNLDDKDKTNLSSNIFIDFIRSVKYIITDRINVLVICLALNLNCFLVKNEINQEFYREYKNYLETFPLILDEIVLNIYYNHQIQ